MLMTTMMLTRMMLVPIRWLAMLTLTFMMAVMT